jgi:hypothetical protein
MTELRGFLLPSFVQSFKMAADFKMDAKKLMRLIFACIIVSMAIGIWNNVRLGYEYGGLTMQEWWARGAGAQSPARNAKSSSACCRTTSRSTGSRRLSEGWAPGA